MVAWYQRLWMASMTPEWIKFHGGIGSAKKIQLKILKKIIASNKRCEYGRDHHFSKLKTYDDFKEQVPIIEEYDALKGYIDRYKYGKKKVLCSEKLVGFEKTSGSTGMIKFIPYTKSLQTSFSKALAPWMCTLFRDYPKAFNGKSFWALSPAFRQNQVKLGDHKVGLQDEDYLNASTRYFLAEVNIDTNDLRKESDSNLFYDQLIQKLLVNDIHFVSCWSPNYWVKLMDRINEDREKWADWLASDDHSKERKLELKRAFAKPKIQSKDLWPHLHCLSCWMDAQSNMWEDDLKKCLGDVYIQRKGLIATEGIYTIPYGNEQTVLAYRSHFFEFRSLSNDQIYLCNALEINDQYEIILTNGAGLYRYATHDIVQLESYRAEVPVLRFVGRKNRVSDMVGEKLSEAHIIKILAVPDTPMKSLVRAMKKGSKTYYQIDHTAEISKEEQEIMRSILKENPYYDQALISGQLSPIQFNQISLTSYLDFIEYDRIQKGIKEGDYKVPVLIPISK